MIWPVYHLRDYFVREYIAHFFSWSEAASFAMQNDLYMAEPVYDWRIK